MSPCPWKSDIRLWWHEIHLNLHQILPPPFFFKNTKQKLCWIFYSQIQTTVCIGSSLKVDQDHWRTQINKNICNGTQMVMLNDDTKNSLDLFKNYIPLYDLFIYFFYLFIIEEIFIATNFIFLLLLSTKRSTESVEWPPSMCNSKAAATPATPPSPPKCGIFSSIAAHNNTRTRTSLRCGVLNLIVVVVQVSLLEYY